MEVRIHEKRFKGAIRLRTQTAVARAMGMSQPGLAKKLKDLKRLRLSDFNRICEILGDEPNEFLVFDRVETAPALG